MPAKLEPLELMQIPHHFRCPISLELMRDPVTVCTGQTYDRSSIESWVATGNTTCPVTRVQLTDFTLIPNHTLRRLIQDWCVANRCFGVERIPTPKQPAEPVLVRSLLSQASACSGPYSLKISAVRRLRALARESEKNRSVIVAAASNAIEILLSIAFEIVGSESESESELSELSQEAIAVLSMFALSESECLFVVSDSERVRYLVNLLFHSSIDVRVNSAAMIENVVARTRSPELRSTISAADGVFNGVIGILNYPLVYPRALKIGIKALFALCMVKQHRHKAVAAGAVEALIDKMTDFEKYDAESAGDCGAALPDSGGCAAFEAHALTVPLLVKIILKVSDRATEYAAGGVAVTLLGVGASSGDAVAAGVLTQLLLLVQSDCTERAKRKAQMLLKLLRDSWPHDYVAKSEDYFAGSDVVLF